MSRRIVRMFAGTIIVGLWLANRARAAETPAGQGDSAITSEQQRAAVPVASDKKAEIEAFAARIENSVKAGDATFLESRLDLTAIADKAADGLTLPPAVRKGVVEGMATNSVAKQVAAVIAGGGSYRFLRARQVGGKTTILFRLLSSKLAVDYHEYSIQPNDQDYKATSVYIYSSGENYSETLRRILIPIAAEQYPGQTEKLTAAEQDFVRNGRTLKVAGQQFAGNQTKAALETIATLPLSLRQNKSVMLLRVRCAGAAGGKDYEDAMDDFAALFPNDPAANMLLMDGYALKKQYDKAIRAIDSVEQCVGGDAWLKRLRGNLFAMSDRLDLAIAEYRKAVAEEPDLKAAYWAWVNVTLTQKDFKETVRVLGEIEDRFDIRNREFPGVPMFADFVKSEEFKTWLVRKKTTPVAKP